MQNQQQELETLREKVEILQEENLQLKTLLKPDFQCPVEWKLTLTEKDYFKALLKRNLASKDFIYETAYFSKENQPDKSVIDVYICRLRKKLNPFGVEITTAHSIGYALKYRQAWADRLSLPPIAKPNQKGQ